MRPLVEKLHSVVNGVQMLYVEYAGNSNEDHPVGNFVTGSSILCVDNGKVLFYDETLESTDKWAEPQG